VIVIDTSAPIAIMLGEPLGRACLAILGSEPEVLISAGTLSELLAAAARRDISEQVGALINGLGLKIVSVTHSTAIAVGGAYRKWGKGIHPPGLNFGDCFAYVLAKEYSCPLLYIGDDFAHTDVRSAL
jgi:ribonuclease VapC